LYSFPLFLILSGAGDKEQNIVNQHLAGRIERRGSILIQLKRRKIPNYGKRFLESGSSDETEALK
jgi:hypothetical protein